MVVVDWRTYGFNDVAIQSALDSLPSTGGKVFIPEGTWTLNSALTMTKDATTLCGAGRGTILTGGITNGILVQADRCIIKDMRCLSFSGYSIDVNGQYGEGLIENIYINTVYGVSLSNGPNDWIIKNNWFSSAVRGINIGSSGAVCMNNIVSNNIIGASSGVTAYKCIAIGDLAENNVISANIIFGRTIFVGSNIFGIEITSGNYNCVIGNVVKDTLRLK